MKFRKDAKDMVGHAFGYLKVISAFENKKSRGVYWKCLCSCGEECIAYGGHLRSGDRVSCGCKAEKSVEKTGFNSLYSHYKRKAKIRGKEFLLSRDKFEELARKNCFYCNQEPSQIRRRQKSKKVQIKYNGIDRIDSTVGYIEENCVPCCKYCNQSKSDLTIQEWKDHIRRIVKWLSIDL